MIQTKKELEDFYIEEDPWKYENDPEDQKRLNTLLSEIPPKDYNDVLDIGCGHGFITRHLPGTNISGLDLSSKAISYAQRNNPKKINYSQGSIFDIDKIYKNQFDLIIITGVLYPQYIGKSHNLIYLLIDKILKRNGILISVHIDNWYDSKFPYLTLKQYYYDYRIYLHKLEIYYKQ